MTASDKRSSAPPLRAAPEVEKVAEHAPAVVEESGGMLYRRAPLGRDDTDYLLSGSANARFLRRSMDDVDAGRVVFVDPDAFGVDE